MAELGMSDNDELDIDLGSPPPSKRERKAAKKVARKEHHAVKALRHEMKKDQRRQERDDHIRELAREELSKYLDSRVIERPGD